MRTSLVYSCCLLSIHCGLGTGNGRGSIIKCGVHTEEEKENRRYIVCLQPSYATYLSFIIIVPCSDVGYICHLSTWSQGAGYTWFTWTTWTGGNSWDLQALFKKVAVMHLEGCTGWWQFTGRRNYEAYGTTWSPLLKRVVWGSLTSFFQKFITSLCYPL